MAPSPHPVLVQVTRGGIAESFHRGSVAIVDGGGHLHTAWGDVERPVFPRSAVKLLQALPLVASGAADALGLSDEELALACASHGGEPEHVRVAASMLAKAGLDADVLECGVHWPYHDGSLKALARSGAEPTALNHNCSGKHAGFACLGCALFDGAHGALLAARLRGYRDPDHAVMREVTASLAATTGHDLASAARGVDGCSIPTYAIPLRKLAHAFAKVAAEQGLSDGHRAAARRLRHAIAAHPFMVAGSGRFDTRVMQALGDAVCCKVGAEGVHCAALPTLGLGVAIKMDDGNNARAVEAAMAAVLQRLLAPAGAAGDLLARLADAPIVNWNGIEVGRLQATLP